MGVIREEEGDGMGWAGKGNGGTSDCEGGRYMMSPTQQNTSFGWSEWAGLRGEVLLADHRCSDGKRAGI